MDQCARLRGEPAALNVCMCLHVASSVTRAQAYSKLQYDFPIVSAGALTALRTALAGGGVAALQQFPITAQLLNAVEEGARSRETKAVRTSRDEANCVAVHREYQLLAGVLLCVSLQQLLLADDVRADALLARLLVRASEYDDSVVPVVAGSPASAVEEPDDQCGSGSDSDWEAPLLASAATVDTGLGTPAFDSLASLPIAQRVDSKLLFAGTRLRYELVDAPGVWESLELSTALLGVLRALRARPRPCASSIRTCAARVLCERWTRAVDAELPAAMCLLAEEAADGGEEAVALPLLLLGRLALQASSSGSAAQGSYVGALWTQVHACMAPVVAPRAEQIAAAARGAPSTVSAEVDALGAVVSFYAAHAPGGVDTVGTTLLTVGVVRSIVALLPHADSAPLRRATILACAASPTVASYVAAVPLASAAVLQQANISDAERAVWPVVLAAPTAIDPETALLCMLLSEGASDAESGTSAPRAAVTETLLLLKDAMRAAGAGRRLWVAAGDVSAALRRLRHSLLARPMASSEPAAKESASEWGSRTEDSGASDLSATPTMPAQTTTKAQARCAAVLRAVKDVVALDEDGRLLCKSD